MSVSVYDLGLRLRAIATGVPQRRVTNALYRAPFLTVAVAAIGEGRYTVRASDGPAARSATWQNGNAASTVAAIGRAIQVPGRVPHLDASSPVTLVTDTAETLRVLTTAAANVNIDGPANRAAYLGAAAIAAWAERAAHPGTSAVIVLSDALNATYMPPTGKPHASLAAWAGWLGCDRPDNAAAAVLALVPAVASFNPVPFPSANQDEFKWRSTARICDDNSDLFRGADSHRRAAIGLFSRNSAVEMFDRFLLDDPAWRSRQHFAGTAPQGTIESFATGELVVRFRHTPFRFRVDESVIVDRGVEIEQQDGWTAKVASVAVSPEADLMVTLRVTGPRYTDAARRNADAEQPLRRGLSAVSASPEPGDTIVVLPRPASPGQASRSEANLAHRFNETSWVTASPGAPKPTIRRQVPLDVIVASAGAAD